MRYRWSLGYKVLDLVKCSLIKIIHKGVIEMKGHEEGLSHTKCKVDQNRDEYHRLKLTLKPNNMRGTVSCLMLFPFVISGLFVEFAPFCCILIMVEESKSLAEALEYKVYV